MCNTLLTNGEHLRVAEVKSFLAIPKSMRSVNGDRNGSNLKKWSVLLVCTIPGRTSTLSLRRWRARLGNAFRFMRGGSPSGRQAVPEVFNPRLRDRSCYLEAPACYSFPIRPEISSVVTTSCVRIRPCLSDAPCLGRLGASHTEKRFRRRTWRSCSPIIFIQRATQTHES